MITIDRERTAADLLPAIDHLFELSAKKIRAIEDTWRVEDGAPVFTIAGRYRSRGWTEWTQGFQFGSALLQFDATGDTAFLELGRSRTVERMASHLTHVGVHDHGFNNVSTYGNLWRLAREGKFHASAWELRFYELALKVTGAVQANGGRRSPTADSSIRSTARTRSSSTRSARCARWRSRIGSGITCSKNKTLESICSSGSCSMPMRRRSTASTLGGAATSTTCVDAPRTKASSTRQTEAIEGQAANRAIPFSTWTRGLAWAMLGFAEQIEFLTSQNVGSDTLYEAALATSDFYIEQAAAADGIPYWDTGAPGLAALGDWAARPAEPFNDHEPVDSSAAAIAAQGLMRLGWIVTAHGGDGQRYLQAGLRILDTLINVRQPYLSLEPAHQGLLLHSVYHRPNGWDHVPEGSRVPRGESSMWGDYHLRELALYVKRLAEGAPYLTFFGGGK